MAGIYIHIPFCKKACHYCNFHFSTNLQYIDELTDAICAEIALQRQYLTNPIDTIYFGGGTPSIVGADNLRKIVSALHTHFKIRETHECTLEANPDDINDATIIAWKNIGINRLSIGIQSFDDAELVWMNRAHNATHAVNCIKVAVANGIDNLSVDLIYGTPLLTNEKWIENIEKAVALGVKHLSCYALTVEPNTALEKMILQNKKEPVDANKAAMQMEILMEHATKFGFEHYEISNLAMPGFRSKHNSAYWQGTHYLGVGPSAHSFNSNTRQWNVANNSLYLHSIAQGLVPFEVEHLSTADKYNEYLMTSLRTIEGVDMDKLFKIQNTEEKLLCNIERYINEGLAVISKNRILLTNKGRLRADGIASDLFI